MLRPSHHLLLPGFPRSKERGLIEAAGRAPGFTPRDRFPRSKERGLIEARQTSAPADRLARSFRVRKNAASLKLAYIAPNNRGGGSFPRSKERGLIEACKRCSQLFEGKFFPRSKERGLIEATQRRSRSTAADSAFRVRKNAASLKQQSLGLLARRRHSFPRSKERGLIEAPSICTDRAPIQHLSAFERTRPH